MDGKIVSIGNYKNGEKEGEEKYFRDGNISSIGIYINGK
jgi:antitoxin component YwqK of YwqJK toxin-antitoxin module